MSFINEMKNVLQEMDSEYLSNDIEIKPISYEISKYDKDSNISYEKTKGYSYQTKDGKYYSKPDSSEFSYWYDYEKKY